VPSHTRLAQSSLSFALELARRLRGRAGLWASSYVPASPQRSAMQITFYLPSSPEIVENKLKLLTAEIATL
jgi:hypothetical protein